MKPTGCAHEHATTRIRIYSHGAVVIATQCAKCGAIGVRSLGPSNDRPPAVRREMRIADALARGPRHSP